MRIGMLAVAGALGLAACGPTAGEVIDTYRAKIEAKRAEIVSILDTVLPKGEIAPVAGLAKPFYLYHDEKGERSTNVAFLPLKQLKDGNAEVELDFTLWSDLGVALAWIDDKDYPREERAPPHFTPTFEGALKTPFVGLYDRVEYEPAKMLDGDRFQGGRMVAAALIIELETKTVVASCSAWSTGSKEINVVGRDVTPETVEETARDDMEMQIHKELELCFAKQTGGKFSFWS